MCPTTVYSHNHERLNQQVKKYNTVPLSVIVH